MAKYKDFDDEIIFDSGSNNPVKSVRSKKKKEKNMDTCSRTRC